MRYIITNRAPSEPGHRGVTHEAAMRFLEQMERDDHTVDSIMEAYNALHADSAPLPVQANLRVLALDPNGRLVVAGVAVAGLDRVAQAMQRPAKGFDTASAYARFNRVGRAS